MDRPFEIKEVPERYALVVHRTLSLSDLPQAIGESYHLLADYLGQLGETPCDVPYTAYLNMDMAHLKVEMGFPTDRLLPGQEPIQAIMLPAGLLAGGKACQRSGGVIYSICSEVSLQRVGLAPLFLVKGWFMAERSRHAQAVYDALAERVEALGVDLVDVAFVREGPSTILRILIDKDGGVTLDDCTEVNHLVDPIIDHELKLSSHDYLEVSSPGLERPLKTDRELARYQGVPVEFSLYQALDGKKKFPGKLGPFTAETVMLVLSDGSVQEFARDKVAKIKRIVVFE